MAEDEYEVRPRGQAETERFFIREDAGRRRRRPDLEEIAPGQLQERLETVGSRRRVSGFRVTAPGYSWRWPWAALAHADIADSDLEGVRIEARLLRSSRLDDCRFERVDMGGAQIGGTAFTGCTFERVSLSGTARGAVRNSAFRRCSLQRLDARGVLFDRVTFEDCAIDGLRGRATIFRGCSFGRIQFRGAVTGIVLDGCTFDDVDMSDARMSGSFMIDSKIERAFLLPAQRSGFAIEYQAYRSAVEHLAPTLSEADAAALRAEVGSWATNPPQVILIDDETFGTLSTDGRRQAMDGLFEHRLVRRG